MPGVPPSALDATLGSADSLDSIGLGSLKVVEGGRAMGERGLRARRQIFSSSNDSRFLLTS